MRELEEVLHDAGAVVARDHLADQGRQSVAVREREAVLHVSRHDPGGHERVELVVRIGAGLVLDEGERVPHLADVVVISADARDQRVRADDLGGPLGEVRHQQRVVIGARRAQQQLPEQRMVGIAELPQLENGRDAENVTQDGHSGEGQEARAEAADHRTCEQLRDAQRIGRAADQQERENHADAARRDRDGPGREFTRGGGAAHRRHAEQGRHEQIRDQLDLARHDADMERAGDLCRERGAPVHKDRQHHRHRRERREVDENGVPRDE